MLKRNFAVLIGGAVLAGSVNLAAGDTGNVPVLPAAAQHHLEKDRALAAEAAALAGKARTSPYPSGAGLSSGIWPSQSALQYFRQKEGTQPKVSLAPRQVVVGPATRYINVSHEETVVIQNSKGQRFVWTANTLGEADLALKAIAPRDFSAGDARVFVSHPQQHQIDG